jgi:peptidoglycan/LPS O-acetylase OafA/YrhL
MLGAWIAQMLLVQPYFPSITWEYLWNVPGWSVACEAFFYLLFPWIILTMSRRFRSGPAIIGFAAVCYIAQIIMFFAAAHVIRRVVAESLWLERLDLIAYRLPFFRLPEFVIGCCAGVLFLDHRPAILARVGSRNFILLACLIAIALNIRFNSQHWTGTGFLNWYIFYTPVFAVMILCLACGRTFLTRILDHPAIVLLGEASYSLYLIHWGAVLTLNARYAPGRAPPLIALLAAICCIGASVVCWRWFEQPARRWLRARRENPSSTRTPVATGA